MALVLLIVVVLAEYAASLVVPALRSYLETDRVAYFAVAVLIAYVLAAHSGLMVPTRPYFEAHPKEYGAWRRLNLATSCVVLAPAVVTVWPELLPPLGPDFGFRPVHLFSAALYGLVAGIVVTARYQLESRIKKEMQANLLA